MAEGLQAPVEQPLRFALLRRDLADDLLVEAAREGVARQVADEAVLVRPAAEFAELGIVGTHRCLLMLLYTPSTHTP
ncbi:hypothetical protein FQZ97_1158130 [compost metagenome]